MTFNNTINYKCVNFLYTKSLPTKFKKTSWSRSLIRRLIVRIIFYDNTLIIIYKLEKGLIIPFP